MIRYSKPLGNLLDFKQDFFHSNDVKLDEFRKTAAVYSSQPRRRACKNCLTSMDFSPDECFTKLDVEYAFCSGCGHCNGAHEDTVEFCRFLYTDNKGENYARNYAAGDMEQYKKRVTEIYLPKAQFLKEALTEEGEQETRLVDFGAGAGYFVSAAKQCGFSKIRGYEPSATLADMGNAMLGEELLIHHELEAIISLIENSEANVASFVGVLEHLQNPREALKAISENKNIQYVFFSVPLFSPTVVLETVFPEIMPRHLVAGHTHLYTERSIQHFCDEFGFERRSEWWFGLDITDLSRSVLVSLQKQNSETSSLQRYWSKWVMPMVDKLQNVLDEARQCSEVHMLIRKNK